MDRILFIQLERVGDLVMGTPLIQDLIQSTPRAQVDLLVMEGCENAVRGLPGLGEIRTLSDKLRGLDDELAQGFKRREISPKAFDVFRQLALPHSPLARTTGPMRPPRRGNHQ